MARRESAMNAMKLMLEELSLSAWPALQTRVYDGWILRFAEGCTKRSNSVNPLYPSTIGPEEKIAACEGLYSDQGLPTIFKIVDCEAQKGLDAVLAEKGYAALDETSLQTMDLNRYEGGTGGGPELEVGEAFDEAWIRGFCACSGKEADMGTIRRILSNILPRKIVAKAAIGGRVVGCGYGALDRGCVGIFDIVVAEEMRGRGFGERIVRAILEGAKDSGAGRSYLQVVVGNAPAERLYGKLGFREAYRYRYRKK
jgi:N-acetylglutamate synthase